MDPNPAPPFPAPPKGNNGKWFIAWIAAMILGPLIYMASVTLGDGMERKYGHDASHTFRMLVTYLYWAAITIVPLILGWKLTLGKGPVARVALTLVFALFAIAVGAAIGFAECS